jgi:hypothetical protein
MKTKKTTTAILILIACLLVILCGCYQTKDGGKNTTQENSEESAEPHVDDDLGVIRFEIDNETNLSYEIIKHIKAAKLTKEGDVKFASYERSRIAQVKKFYNLDNLKIDGYRLNIVEMIQDGGLRFYFDTTEKKIHEEGYSSIQINIFPLLTNRRQTEYFEGFLNQATRQGWGYLTEDDMIYSKKHKEVFAKMDNNMTLNIQVTDEKLSNYEFLRDLAFEVMEKAELVVTSDYDLDKIDISELINPIIENSNSIPPVTTDDQPINSVTSEPVAVAE